MRIQHYTLEVGPTSTSWTALGHNGASIIHMAKGETLGEKLLRLALDPALAPTVVLGNADGECTRARLRANTTDLNSVGSLTTGLIADEIDPLVANRQGGYMKLEGRVNYDSGSPADILHIADDFLPLQATAISALMIGPTTATLCAAMISDAGVVSLSGAAPAPTADFDVRLDGKYPIA